MAVDTPVGAPVEHKRATVRTDKAEAVAALAEAFRTASAAVLTEYRGLTVKQVTALRVALGNDTTYSVVKNTLTRLAAVDAGLEGMDALLSGPTAVAFVNGEPVEAAKALRDYARTNPQLVVKGGVLDGKPLTADEIRRLADLESRDVLLGKMAGALMASLTNAVYLFAAPLQQVARLAGALEAKAQDDSSVIGGAGTPVPLPEAGPVDEVVPAAETVPVDEAAGAAEAAPVHEAAPVEEAAPADGALPVDQATSDTSTPETV